ncbi:MAG: deoxyribodipyrimidine photo-lyase [Microbacteriaceae bacterium]|nr:deoxyribodipyrimidine photo-lyase [Microbacteriaceae bacterium]
MSASPSIVWFRHDLRLADNPALQAALARGQQMVLLYIHDDVSPGMRPMGGASAWWTHHSLVSLSNDIRALGGQLVLRQGPAHDIITALVEETGAGGVYWNRRYGRSRDGDQALKTHLRNAGVTCESFGGNLLFEPWSVATGEGKPFRVFTPFWRACVASEPPRLPLPAPTSLECVPGIASDEIETWGLTPHSPDWSAEIAQMWTPGEAGAHARLEDFIENILREYHRRDEPGPITTSRLSPHLRSGEISPQSIWYALERNLPGDAQANKAKFLSEIGWREFSYNILYHFPELDTANYRPEFDRFPWGEPEPSALRAWHQGRTGIPLVDAGMRELWHTGYMHNRVRMVTASFLIKNLLVDWRVGESWFWDTLVDADEANNPASWQWVAGSGADAAPYFRVFNPVLQAEKFDPEQVYIKRWIPEIGTDAYPDKPIADLKASREVALAAFAKLKGERPPE